VAQLEEGLRLRCVPGLEEARIYVLSGLAPGDEVFYRDNALEPVLNTLAEAEAWAGFARDAGAPLPAALQVESGMNRLGMTPHELERYLGDPALREGIALTLVMSHLACADEPDHPQNAAQKSRFEAVRARFPGVPASLANSGGVFLGPDYAFDMTRPGIALYGGAPNARAEGHLAPVVSLAARVLQVREIDPGETVGYGATFRADRPRRIATLSAGYADGLLRSAASGGIAYFAGAPAPLAGRVSMDSIGVDITGLPAGSVRAGDWAELLGPHQSVDTLAGAAGTIAYEILTGLGRRAFTQYNGSRPGADGA
jgi:alanine racemase